MERRSSSRALVPIVLAGGGVTLVIAATRSTALAVLAGSLALGATVLILRSRSRRRDAPDPGRRRLLTWAALGGLMWVAGGATIGRAVRRLSAPDTKPTMDEMASGLGTEYMEILQRTFRPGRSGEIQLLLAPYNSSNYSNESVSLVPRDPRTSHASVWMYLERIPLAVYAPGIVEPSDSTQRVSLADIAPTIATLTGFEEFLRLGREGQPLPGIARPAAAPKLVVVFVIDGGGWNVLKQWPDAWPALKRLWPKSALFRNAIHGSFPAVTACAHATIGTGAYPRDHGVTGHNIRDGSGVRKAYGTPGGARPDDILIPTLADLWYDANGGKAWVGEIGYQVWHLGMLGRGGTTRPPGDKPVGAFWDEYVRPEAWRPHNPDLYRLPIETPGLDVYEAHKQTYAPNAPPPDPFDPKGRQVPCCEPPIVQYQGDLIDATLRSERLGTHGATDLLFVNFKSPDYTGHVYNMLDDHERIVLEAVDAELARLVGTLESTFAPGEFALIVTADHGQCPLPDAVDGTRLDPIQLQEDIQRAFGKSLFGVVQYVAPSEVFLDRRALWDAEITADEIAAFLKDYRYRDNIGPYVPKAAIERNLMDNLEFAGVFGAEYLESLRPEALPGFGESRFAGGDPFGVPDPLTL
ncbi:MAG: alkaline phosphatase family protein [Actinobacteria bacterium]|nr:alkaline phosphatase family protein [Actinomycetota bacterium]